MAAQDSEPIYKRVKRHNIPGHVHFVTFSCYQRLPLLTNDVWRGWLGTDVRSACDNLDVALWAYVFMPEHVHLLVRPRRDVYKISDFLYAVKKPFGERVIALLREEKSKLLRQLEVDGAGRRRYRFWQPGGGFDGNIWTWEKAIQKAMYCHGNPVKRRLVKSAEQWRWSSFRWLELGQVENEPLRVDSWEA
jgi:putative transposase